MKINLRRFKLLEHKKNGITLVRKRRKAKSFHIRSDAVIDAVYQDNEPPWRAWMLTFLSIITALNTADLAVAGVAFELTIPFFLNLAFVAINISVACYYLYHTIVDVFANNANRMMDVVKLAIVGGLGYTFAKAGMATLAALTPNAGSLLVALFMANSIAIGVNVGIAATGLFLPWMYKKCKNLFAKMRRKHPDPIMLTKKEEKIMTRNDDGHYHNCVSYNRSVLTKFLELGLSGSIDTPNEKKKFAKKARRHVALMMKARKYHSERKAIASTLREQSDIQVYNRSFKTVVKDCKMWENTEPYNTYMKNVKTPITKISHDLAKAYRLDKLLAKCDNDNVDKADTLLKTICGRDSLSGDMNITIDKLKSGLKTVDVNESTSQDYLTMINDYTIQGKPLSDLNSALSKIVEMAKTCLTDNHFKKLLKLHDQAGFSLDEIKEALKRSFRSLENEDSELSGFAEETNYDEIVQPVIDYIKNRVHSCSMVDEAHQHCIA